MARLTEAEYKKAVVKIQNLPDTIKGDGRYVMSLIKQILDKQATQINLANGFTLDEVQGQRNNVPAPRFFTLTWSRNGGRLDWAYPTDPTKVTYYELRTSLSKIGIKNNDFLERTTNNYSTVLPVNKYSATIYLLAFNSKGEYNYVSLQYTKPRPLAPTDIALTKNNEGTLITFLDIPSDCIGANVYVDGQRFATKDNLLLYDRASQNHAIKKVEVAYYDQFGEGERGVLNCVIPDVTGFLVERNGANLDFYWDPIDVYNVVYEVRVSQSTVWNTASKLFTSKTNTKNRYIYPNEGEYYLLIKAVDTHGNYSENATYQFMSTPREIQRNIIKKYNHGEEGYPGTKINMDYNYSTNNITLNNDAYNGEYVFSVSLEQRYRARNWLSYDLVTYTKDETIWDDADFSWDGSERSFNGPMVDSSFTEAYQYIATYIGAESEDTFLAHENQSITPSTGGSVLESKKANVFDISRFGYGVKITPVTKLSYNATEIPSVFRMLFTLKLNNTGKLCSGILMALAYNTSRAMYVIYEKRTNTLKLVDTAGHELSMPYPGATENNKIDWITFGISQSSTERALYATSLFKNRTEYVTGEFVPLGLYNKIYCYPRVIAV